jgi:hypothetical protein
MMTILRASGIEFRRTSENWDSAEPSSPLAQRRIAPREGQPFVLEQSGGTTAGLLIQVTPQPVPLTQQEEFARSLIHRVATARRMESLLERASKQANVSYQTDFAP